MMPALLQKPWDVGEWSLDRTTAFLPPLQVPWAEVDLVMQGCLIVNSSAWGLEVPGSQMETGLTTMRQLLFSLSCTL